MLELFGFGIKEVIGGYWVVDSPVGPAQGGLPEYEMSELPARRNQAHYLLHF